MENMKEQTREQAVAIGQMLMHRNIIRHVTNTQPFADANYFYRFIMVCHIVNNLNITLTFFVFVTG